MKTCKQCGNSFTDGPATKAYCSKKCKQKAKHEREKESNRVQKTCEHCGTSYLAWGQESRFCSGKCASLGTREAWATIPCRHCRKSVLKKCAVGNLYCSEDCLAKHHNRTCPVCRKSYIGRTKCCSEKCSLTLRQSSYSFDYQKMKIRSAERSKQKQDLFFQLIGQLHGWNCNICGKPVELDATENNMRPSHDHVVPLTKGGSNTPDNVRLAHRGCNSSKGNRGVRNFRTSTPDPTRPSHRINSAVLKLHE